MALRTDYKDDILDLTQNAQRKYRMISNSDGTVSFEDVTAYSQVGDSFGSADLNALALAIIESSGNIDYFPDEDMIKIKDSSGVWHDWSSGGLNEIALIPTMTSNTAPYGSCTGSLLGTGTNDKPYIAFDGNKETVVGSDAKAGTSYVQYTFDKPVNVSRLELLLGKQDGVTAPVVISGLLEDGSWVTLISTNVAFAGQGTKIPLNYTIPKTTIAALKVEITSTSTYRSLYWNIQAYGTRKN